VPIIETLATILARLIPSALKQRLGKLDRRANACIEFRNTFIKELTGLYPRPTNWPKGIGIEPTLKAKFPALQAAVAMFRPFVPDADRERFDQAWRDYRNDTKREIDHQSYTHYMDITSTSLNTFGGETVLPTDGKANFKRNVDRLLAFASDI
jgi:hypothetical protein